MLAASCGGDLLGLGLPLLERGLEVVSVHPGDELHADLLGADRLALAVVRAAPEALRIHLIDHRSDAAVLLGLALGEGVEVPYLGRDEEHGRGVRASGDAGAAGDA